MFETSLQNLGLTEKEAKVYLASLELGPETAQNIAKKSIINRATTYVQIDSLKKKGLMSEFEKGKKTFYVAESPNRISSLLAVFEKDLELKKAEVSSILPGLLDMFAGMGERPKVRFFEGMEGVRGVLDDIIRIRPDTINILSDLDGVEKLYLKDQKMFDEYTEKRIKAGIKSKFLYTCKNGPVLQHEPGKLRQAKYFQHLKMPIKADINIYKNKVVLMSYRDNPIGVAIENQDIADTFKAMLEAFWQG